MKKALCYYSNILLVTIIFIPDSSLSQEQVFGDVLTCTSKIKSNVISCSDLHKYELISVNDPSEKIKLVNELLANITNEEVQSIRNWNIDLLRESMPQVEEQLGKHLKSIAQSLYRISKSEEEFKKYERNPILYLKKYGAFPINDGEFLPGIKLSNEEYLNIGKDVKRRYEDKLLPPESELAYIYSSKSETLAIRSTETNYDFKTGSLSESKTEYGYSSKTNSLSFSSGNKLIISLPNENGEAKINDVRGRAMFDSKDLKK